MLKKENIEEKLKNKPRLKMNLRNLFKRKIGQSKLELRQSLSLYKKSKKNYNKARFNYINFLKNNSMWNDELEEKYNPQHSNNILKMDEFSEDFIIRYTRAKIQKANKKLSLNKTKTEYGYDKQKSYEFYLELINVVEEICRLNKWITREDWIKHGLPMNKFMKGYIKAAIGYGDVLKYYAKKRFDARQSIHMGR